MKSWSVIALVMMLDVISSASTTTTNSSTATIVPSTTIAPIAPIENLAEYCWNDSHSCNVIGNFTRKKIGLSFPVNIDCLDAGVEGEPPALALKSFRTRLFRRFHSIEVISLNGCGVNHRERNFLGTEYIPDPAKVIHLLLEMFKIDREIKNGTFGDFKSVETLTLINNELLSGINRTTFRGLTKLKKLVLDDNRLGLLDEWAFEEFAPCLQQLVIHDRSLILRKMVHLQNITLIDLSVKELNWTVLMTESKFLETIRVQDTKIIDLNNKSDHVFKHISELHLTSDELKHIPSNKFPNLLLLNVSQNQIVDLTFGKNQLDALQKLDVSHNQLTVIDDNCLAPLLYLEFLVASHNKITMIKRKAFNHNRYLRLIDISHNHLKLINLDPAIFMASPHLELRIDANPWSCIWIMEFSANEPHIFTMKFLYTKFTDRLNMRGLKCQFYPNDDLVMQHHYHLYENTHLHHNHTHPPAMLPAPPVEIMRRNTKHTATITIIILVVGVAFLLVVLYFHIKCRPMASSLQSPFYRTLPTNHSSGDRADIVRRILPPTDYESPLSERMKLSLESINELRPDASLFTDIDLKDLYEEIPEKRHDVEDDHLDLDDFSYHLTKMAKDMNLD